MDEICKFLTHMEQPRLLEDGDFEEEEGVVRTEEEKNELREKILLGVNIFHRNIFSIIFYFRKKKLMECMKEIKELKIKLKKLFMK